MLHLRRRLAWPAMGATVSAVRSRPRRNRALCCRCGQLRTVARSYRGRRPDGAPDSDPVGPWCTWLRCSHCGATTIHALIVDALADRWIPNGCDREQRDRRADQHRRRIERRLRALAAEGVTVVRAVSPGEMNLDEAIVEVIEYADARGFVLLVNDAMEPSRVLHAVELAEDLVDAPSRLGPWADDADGLRRGLAFVDSTL